METTKTIEELEAEQIAEDERLEELKKQNAQILEQARLLAEQAGISLPEHASSAPSETLEARGGNFFTKLFKKKPEVLPTHPLELANHNARRDYFDFKKGRGKLSKKDNAVVEAYTKELENRENAYKESKRAYIEHLKSEGKIPEAKDFILKEIEFERQAEMSAGGKVMESVSKFIKRYDEWGEEHTNENGELVEANVWKKMTKTATSILLMSGLSLSIIPNGATATSYIAKRLSMGLGIGAIIENIPTKYKAIVSLIIAISAGAVVTVATGGTGGAVALAMGMGAGSAGVGFGMNKLLNYFSKDKTFSEKEIEEGLEKIKGKLDLDNFAQIEQEYKKHLNEARLTRIGRASLKTLTTVGTSLSVTIAAANISNYEYQRDAEQVEETRSQEAQPIESQNEGTATANEEVNSNTPETKTFDSETPFGDYLDKLDPSQSISHEVENTGTETVEVAGPDGEQLGSFPLTKEDVLHKAEEEHDYLKEKADRLYEEASKLGLKGEEAEAKIRESTETYKKAVEVQSKISHIKTELASAQSDESATTGPASVEEKAAEAQTTTTTTEGDAQEGDEGSSTSTPEEQPAKNEPEETTVPNQTQPEPESAPAPEEQETVSVSENAIVQKADAETGEGGGITYAFKAQLENDETLANELKDQIGFEGETNTPEFYKALGQHFGYIDGEGHDVRVLSSQQEHVAYQFREEDNGNIVVDEIKVDENGNGQIIETHKGEDSFEKHIEKDYEYKSGYHHSDSGHHDTAPNEGVHIVPKQTDPEFVVKDNGIEKYTYKDINNSPEWGTTKELEAQALFAKEAAGTLTPEEAKILALLKSEIDAANIKDRDIQYYLQRSNHIKVGDLLVTAHHVAYDGYSIDNKGHLLSPEEQLALKNQDKTVITNASKELRYIHEQAFKLDYSISDERLEEVENVYKNNLDKMFGVEREEWIGKHGLDDKPAYKFMKMETEGNGEGKDLFVDFMHRLKEVTGLEPERGGLFGHKETNEEYVTRALLEAEKNGNLEELFIEKGYEDSDNLNLQPSKGDGYNISSGGYHLEPSSGESAVQGRSEDLKPSTGNHQEDKTQERGLQPSKGKFIPKDDMYEEKELRPSKGKN